MKVYIAAPWPLKKYAAQLRALLAVADIACTSRWIDVEPHSDTFQTDFQRAAHADHDLQDVGEADALILYNPLSYRNKGTGGRHMETMYAYTLPRPVLIYGVRSNIFHYLPNIVVSEEFETILARLQEIRSEY